MLFGLCVIALAVMYRGSAVGLRSLSHCIPPASVKAEVEEN
jgi:hypothetical protein